MARIEGRRVRGDDEDYLSTSSSSSEDALSEDDSEDEGDGFAGDADAQVKKLNKKLDKLSAGDSAATDDVPEGPYSKLMGMKFMQTANAARKAANDAEVRSLRRELGQAADESSEYDSEDEAGRLKFGKTEQNKKNAKAPAQQRREFEAPEDDEGQQVADDSENDIQIKVVSIPAKDTVRGAKKQVGDKKNKKASTAASTQQPAEESDEGESNPWLAEPGQEKRRNRKTVDISAEKSLIDNENQLSKSSVKTVQELAPPPRPKASAKKQQKQQQQQQQVQLAQDDETSDSDSDSESKVPVLLKNADLIKRAFAGDEVLDTFEKEKHDVMEEEDDKVVDTTLPGWGSWIGDGLSKKEKEEKKKSTE
ncbi:stearoyl-CoA 9-desaturase, partial [Ascosphaera pollenicola]